MEKIRKIRKLGQNEYAVLVPKEWANKQVTLIKDKEGLLCFREVSPKRQQISIIIKEEENPMKII